MMPSLRYRAQMSISPVQAKFSSALEKCSESISMGKPRSRASQAMANGPSATNPSLSIAMSSSPKPR
ncbi:hypothetical protein SSPIM334S_03962 [Streptomyces spiroverticillatus]